jgi:splicing factor U2AF subunit
MNSRQSRRLMVSKLPPSSTAAEVQHHFNLISRLNVYKEGTGEPVKDVKKATAGNIAMLEFTDSTYATTVLALAGEIEMNGVELEIRRPSGYIVQPPEKDLKMSSDKVSKDVSDSTDKLVIKGLPIYLTSEQGLELVEAFGTVQSWILVSETDSSESKVPPEIKKTLIKIGNCIYAIQRSNDYTDCSKFFEWYATQ